MANAENMTAPLQTGGKSSDSWSRAVMRRALKASLATLNRETGDPYASLVTVAMQPGGAPLTLISSRIYPLETCKGNSYIYVMSKKPMTIRKFDEQFPDDDTCLEHIFRVRYGARHTCKKCGRGAKYYRVKKRRCYECEHCGTQVFPTVGTPFEKSRTPLRMWFQVMLMFTTTRNGVAAKEIQRATGVTYKTAWRMAHLIRRYMGYVDGDAPLGGPGGGAVEIDKAFIGGRDPKGTKDDKAVVLGMVERDAEIITRVVASRRSLDVMPHIAAYVRSGSRVYTDEAHAWNELRWAKDIDHAAVNHKKKEWARGPVHTNSLEGFWANLKRMIEGTHIWVSKKHLQTYLWEAEFRHNLRKEPHLMFEALLLAFPRAEV